MNFRNGESAKETLLIELIAAPRNCLITSPTTASLPRSPRGRPSASAPKRRRFGTMVKQAMAGRSLGSGRHGGQESELRSSEWRPARV